MIRIRQANFQDAEAIASLHAQSWRLAYHNILDADYLRCTLDEDRLHDWLDRLGGHDDSQYVIVAEDVRNANTLAGFACAYGAYDHQVGTLLENLHAHPQHKKQGIGKMLLRQIATWSVHHFPQDALHLWVVAENHPAIGFYSHLGGIQDSADIWDAPGGNKVPELRFTWPDPSCLIKTNQFDMFKNPSYVVPDNS